MSAIPSQVRVLGQVRLRTVVYVRAPAGTLSQARIVYASGTRLSTRTRHFDRRTGVEVTTDPSAAPHTLHVQTPALDAEHAAQAARAGGP